VPIPKNGSTSIPYILPESTLIISNEDEILLDATALIILRDPIERWFSGIAQFYHAERFNNKFLKDDLLDSIYNRAINDIALDPHTYIQTSFFKDIQCQGHIFFYMLDKFKTNSKKWRAKNNIHFHFDKWENLNNSKSSITKIKMINYLKQRVTAQDLKKIRDYYADDYLIINLVKELTKYS